jgi:peptide/nickel transport system substrate-binding protein
MLTLRGQAPAWAMKAIVAPIAALALLLAGGSAAAVEPPPSTLRVELRTDIDYVDPALAYYVPTWTIMYASCAKLVNYPDRPAPEGGQLQPEVARAMPNISSDGRTYTFELRDDFFFSPPSNERVTAAHFKWAIDRALNREMNSPAQSFFGDIVGAEDVIIGRTNSTSGVVAEGSTLRITLARPVGDFLARLAMPFTCPLPLSVPVNRDGIDAPVPSAGPYYIAGWTRTQEILIKENPNYVGERPHHFDEIHYGIGLPLETIKLGIDAGTTDWGDIPPTAHAELDRRFGPCASGSSMRQRYLCYPTPNVLYLAMNHDRPLFGGPGPEGNVALKRAVNFAIDRTAMMEQRGTNGGTPTDQQLPFLLPGFRDADIYPARPDLERARELAAGHTRDGKGVLYCSNGAPAPQICQIVQANLRNIGLDMEIKLFSRATQFEFAGRRGEPFDMTLELWHADYLDPYAFFQLLDGTTIRPANNVNFAYFNDPEYNRRIAEANQLHGSAREAAFGQLDVDIARNAAPWAAYGIPNDRFYFSDRVGCQIYSPHYTINLAALCLRPAISIDDAAVTEGNAATAAAFTVSIAEAAPTDYPVTVSFTTVDGTATADDYGAQTGSVTFAAGETRKTISIDIHGDSTDEPGETFFVQLSNPTTGTVVKARGTGTISDDDEPPPPHPPPPAPDTQPPTDPNIQSTSHRPGLASHDRTVDFTWSGAADNESGVDGFSYLWDKLPTTRPDPSKEAEETASGTTSPALGNGSWWFHLRTRDNAGNWSSTRHLGPFVIVSSPVRCVVPNVKKKTVAQARRLLAARKCALGKVTGTYSAKVKRGRIISQSRGPGARLPRGTRVKIVVSRGRRR